MNIAVGKGIYFNVWENSNSKFLEELRKIIAEQLLAMLFVFYIIISSLDSC